MSWPQPVSGGRVAVGGIQCDIPSHQSPKFRGIDASLRPARTRTFPALPHLSARSPGSSLVMVVHCSYDTAMSRTWLIMLDPPGVPCIVRPSGPHPLPCRGSDPTSCLLPFRARHKKPCQISSRISHCDANALMMGGLVCKWTAVGTHTRLSCRGWRGFRESPYAAPSWVGGNHQVYTQLPDQGWRQHEFSKSLHPGEQHHTPNQRAPECDQMFRQSIKHSVWLRGNSIRGEEHPDSCLHTTLQCWALSRRAWDTIGAETSARAKTSVSL